MIKGIKNYKTSMEVDNLYEGESLEVTMRRVMANKEPIKSISSPIYTERAAGVLAQHDIRTDRFEIAQAAMDKVSASRLAKREERMKLNTEQNG